MTKRSKELRDQQGALLTQARGFLDQVKDDTPEERAADLNRQYDAAMNEFAALEERAKRAEQLESAEAAAAAIADEARRRGVGNAPNDMGSTDVATEARGAMELFDLALRSIDTGFMNELSPEERSTMREIRAQGVGTDAAGGYLVPEGFSGEIDKALAAWGPMLDGGVVRVVTTQTGNLIPWPTVDDTAKRAPLKAESDALTDDAGDDVVIGEKQLGAFVYSSEMIRVSWELMSDSFFSFEELLSDLIAERLGRSANEALTTGGGSGAPNGIVTAAATGKTAAATAAITADELKDLFHSVDPAYRASPSCGWQMNDSTWKLIGKLKDANDRYLLTDGSAGDITRAPASTLFGRPIWVNQAMANATAALAPIVFGDFRKYAVRRVGGMSITVLRERYAERHQNGFMGHLRIDGELINTAAVKKLVMLA